MNLGHTVSVALTRCLTAAGMTQAELARATGLSETAHQPPRRGKAALSAEVAVRIEEAPGLPAQVLMHLQANQQIQTARARRLAAHSDAEQHYRIP